MWKIIWNDGSGEITQTFDTKQQLIDWVWDRSGDRFLDNAFVIQEMINDQWQDPASEVKLRTE